MGDYKPVKGDRVRAVLTGTVRHVYADNDFTLAYEAGDGGGGYGAAEIPNECAVSKIEPPVVTFKPGDRIRSKGGSRVQYTLGERGYLVHNSNNWMSYATTSTQPGHWTSRLYELVELK